MAAASTVTVRAASGGGSPTGMKLIAEVLGAERAITFRNDEQGGPACEFAIGETAGLADVREVEPAVYSILFGTRSFEVKIEEATDRYFVSVNGRRFEVSVRDPRRSGGRAGGLEAGGRHEVTSPMPGKVVKVLVEAGQAVENGQGLVVVEAMKMQNEIKSPKTGRVGAVNVSVGSSVGSAEVLVVVE